MSNRKNLIVELYCLACDSDKEYNCEDFNKIIKLQEGFENEWKDEDICLDCAKKHHREITNGLYTDEECDEQEKDLLSRGYKYWNGRWVATGGGVIISYRMMNAIKNKK